MGKTKQRKQVTGWHFAGQTLRDGRPLPKRGEVLVHDGPVVPCESGYHLSESPLDALRYAPGCMVARVRGSSTCVPHGDPVDKWACRRREALTEYVDVRAVLVEWARRVALIAVREYAASALRAAGLESEAAKLQALPDDCMASAASDASYAASYAARTRLSEMLTDMLTELVGS